VASWSVLQSEPASNCSMPARIDLDPERVKHLRKQGMTCLQIAKNLGVSKYKVWTFMVSSGIERHPTSIWNSLDHDRILHLYEKCHSAEQVAQKIGVTRPTIVRVLKFHKATIYGPTQYPELQDPAWLREQYKTLATSDIATKLGCTQSVVVASFQKFGIPLRSRSEAVRLTFKQGRVAQGKGKFRPDISGPLNHNWQGGIAKYPYPRTFSAELRREIRARDGQICQICCVQQKDCKARLSVHRVDYDKHNNVPENLTTLCIPCHVRTNTDRKKWVKYFRRYWKIRTAWEHFNPAVEFAATAASFE